MRIQYIFLFILGILFTACHKDFEGETTITEGTTPGPEIISESQGSITGYIYDENLQAVAGVEVSTYAAQTITDENGVFIFRNTNLDENGTYIRATKAGYIFGSDMIYPKGNESHSAIQLLRLDATETINSSTGGNVEVPGGGSVNFSANSFADQNGNTYSGDVIVTAKRIASDDPNMGDMMPGGLVAMDEEGATRVLGTLGMLAVELRSPSGDELNLASGQTADLTFRIADDLLATAPEEIDLWYFDEVRGLWIEEGKAKLSGSTYEAEVSHFSFWNCDAPFPLINLCGQVVCPGGLVPQWMKVTIEAEGLGAACGYTDSEGVFCGKVPKNAILNISIGTDDCSEPLVIEVGPFSSNTVLDDIVLEKSGLVMTGTVSCNGVPVESGYVLLQEGDNTYTYIVNQDGSYEVNFTDQCSDIDEVSVFAVNLDTGDASAANVVQLNGDVTTLGFDFNVCSDCMFDAEIVFDGSNCVDVVAEVITTGGMGDFNYNWSNNGEPGSQIIVDPGTLICVTVTDADDCEVIQCEDAPFLNQDWIEYNVTNASCGNENGSTEFWFDTSSVSTILVEGPGGYSSTDNPATGMGPGAYTVTVTNEFNCSFTQTFEVVDVADLSIFLQSNWACGPQMINIVVTGGSAPYEYSLNGNPIPSDIFDVLVSGTYCIEVTDANGCIGNECLEIFVSPAIEYTPTTTCNGFDFDITFNSASGQQFYIAQNSWDSLSFSDGDVWDYNFLENGFEYDMLVYSEQCEEEFSIVLPNFNGLSVQANEASCMTCTDGWVDITLDPMGDCFECTVGSTGVFEISDLDTDLSAQNTAQTLGAGEYVVAVFDVNGCLIAFSIIEL